MRTALGCGSVLAGLVVLFHARPAAAESGDFSLEWNAPGGCPSPAFVENEIARLLGHAPGLASDRPVSVRATVSPAGTAFRVRILLSTREGRGERTFRNASCERVALATALVTSLAIDPEAVSASQSEAAPAPQPAERPPPPLSSPPPRRGDTPSARARWFLVGAEPGVDIGIFPSPSMRLAVVAGLSWRSFRYELVAGYDFSHEVLAPGQGEPSSASPPTSRGARLELGTLKIRGCLAAPSSRVVEFDACLSGEAGAFFTEGTGISAPARRTYPWLAALAGVRVVFRFTDFLEGRLEADAGPSLLRPAFEITGSLPGFIYEPSSFVGEGAAALVARFR